MCRDVDTKAKPPGRFTLQVKGDTKALNIRDTAREAIAKVVLYKHADIFGSDPNALAKVKGHIAR